VVDVPDVSAFNFGYVYLANQGLLEAMFDRLRYWDFRKIICNSFTPNIYVCGFYNTSVYGICWLVQLSVLRLFAVSILRE
jgi:hypothetical protein